MATSLEQRVKALEAQVAKLAARDTAHTSQGREWLDDLYGKFKGDTTFAEAMRLGREYRKSQRPSARRSKSRK